MAQETIVRLLDDIDGKPADETVSFSLDGVPYEIDLRSKNADKLRKVFAPYVEKGRKAGARRTGRGGRGRTAHNRERAADIRGWAKEHGISINDRGRIPAEIVQAYEAKDPGRAKNPGAKVPQTKFQAASR
ncbi:histone-like nucleoid-structuring protein Lsr2 [Actinoallomurus iriomotensis]|jgi:Lsr2|uniref:Protein lsr2 n=1 Tax=Actinoallomurus iriomotensis TaxID=478107 RepID=A0A9W6W2R6_9ACTN|nr:protein lsr2 precursor [Actinoallomurus iriomotensis]GLY88719.1 protein lsr2 precursor [Actinoallomurus iriomotensis]